jgi:hypothetical protein
LPVEVGEKISAIVVPGIFQRLVIAHGGPRGGLLELAQRGSMSVLLTFETLQIKSSRDLILDRLQTRAIKI